MKRIICLMLLVVIGSAIIFSLDHYYCEFEYNKNLFQLNRFAERVEYVLTRSIPDKLGIVEDFKSFLIAIDTQEDTGVFDQYAAWVLSHNPTLYWLGYADEAQVIKRVYPLSGNEMVVNHDLKTSMEDTPWAQRAILTQRSILSPPVQAAQGFKAVIAYAPLIKDNEFKGLAICLFRLDNVIDYALMDLIREDPNYYVVLADTTGQILWRSGFFDVSSAVKRSLFPIGETEWVAYVGWRHPPQPDPIARRLLWGAGGTIIILILVIFNSMMNRNIWLDRVVQEKTAELALRSERLIEEIEERKRAEKLASLGTMAAGLSHEINQPLNSIKVIATGNVYSHYLGRGRGIDELIKAMEEISQQVDRIDKIISHMRSFIRRDDSLVLPCDWNTAVVQSLELVGKQLSAHGITLTKLLSDKLPMVLASPTALEEIVVNLLANAMQALDTVTKDDKKIVVRTYFEDGVILEVSDNGPGIAPENREKIFAPFFSTKTGCDNFGLGLAIVNSITASYQGKVRLVTSGSTGAIFQVIFPPYSNPEKG